MHEIPDLIANAAQEAGGNRLIDEVIIGLGFTMVRLHGGAAGLAYTLREELERGCEAYEEAGSVAGRKLQEVLSWIGGSSVLASCIGIAAANAVLLPPQGCLDSDLLQTLDLRPGERVVMVGRFKPMLPVLVERGVQLQVIERGEPPQALNKCDVVLITATTIINNTLKGLLEAVNGAREVVILGPSTPYVPAAFSDTPVTLLAGSVIRDLDKVHQAVAEGGGTRTMGKALGRWVARIQE
jgi:uncharacterized protein (DUF4213/DUF364 family)